MATCSPWTEDSPVRFNFKNGQKNLLLRLDRRRDLHHCNDAGIWGPAFIFGLFPPHPRRIRLEPGKHCSDALDPSPLLWDRLSFQRSFERPLETEKDDHPRCCNPWELTAACGLAEELWHFYLIFGFITPIGLACVGAPVVTPTIINWFAKSRGLAYGIAQMGGGLSFIYAIYAESMISLLGWRYAYLVLGLSIMILLIPVILLFYAGDPSEKNLKP